jgi:hypothetical protein
MEHGTREKIKRWSGTIPFPHGSPSELKFRMYEHMAHFLLNHMIAQEENK